MHWTGIGHSYDLRLNLSVKLILNGSQKNYYRVKVKILLYIIYVNYVFHKLTSTNINSIYEAGDTSFVFFVFATGPKKPKTRSQRKDRPTEENRRSRSLTGSTSRGTSPFSGESDRRGEKEIIVDFDPEPTTSRGLEPSSLPRETTRIPAPQPPTPIPRKYTGMRLVKDWQTQSWRHQI